jgi:ABC-type amino acid transport substrate-binding protein
MVLRWTVRMILIGVLVACCTVGVTLAQTLIVGIPEWKPWQITNGEHPRGITIDILKELAERTGYALDIKPLPHKRMLVEFKTGQITAEPSVDPLWRQDQQDISVYTAPYCTTCDIILVRKGSGIKGTSVMDFKGLSIGCGLGYYYPEGFQEAFARGEINREDTPMGEKNLMKLALNRIDGAILDKIQANYMFNVSGMNPDDFEISYEFQPSKLSLRLHKSKRNLLPTLDEAIARMKADGRVARIVSEYIPSPHLR